MGYPSNESEELRGVSDKALAHRYRYGDLNRYGLEEDWDTGEVRRLPWFEATAEGRYQPLYHSDGNDAGGPPRFSAREMRALEEWASLPQEERDYRRDFPRQSQWSEDRHADMLLDRLRAYQQDRPQASGPSAFDVY